jgi:hypothetical protein
VGFVIVTCTPYIALEHQYCKRACLDETRYSQHHLPRMHDEMFGGAAYRGFVYNCYWSERCLESRDNIEIQRIDITVL